MGNASKKLAEKCTLLSKDEQPIVANSFRFASKNSDKIREDDLIVSVFTLIDCSNTNFFSNTCLLSFIQSDKFTVYLHT